MKKEEQEKHFGWKWFVILGVLAILILGIWVMFFSYAKCETWSCFNNHLENCDRVKFVGGTSMIFEYVVKGISDGECEVDVQLLQGELNNKELAELEMRKMTCMLPEGVVMIPESDIGNCHGMLKEGLQDLVIEKLHSYLVQNLGRINLEVLGVPEAD
ncbi:MAG: hypothetical protein SRB1_02581 [Desulfobacteraceae bacterium Eth-SRB1]|nr:MAG: hypothetical protein SRB1_02581 [Desulfobacteraceae bacterium Eth-SRB1]